MRKTATPLPLFKSDDVINRVIDAITTDLRNDLIYINHLEKMVDKFVDSEDLQKWAHEQIAQVTGRAA